MRIFFSVLALVREPGGGQEAVSVSLVSIHYWMANGLAVWRTNEKKYYYRQAAHLPQ